jgi:hypothetical protein
MPAAPRKNRFAWETLSDAKLLDLRLCDLGLKIPGSPLQARVDQLYGELAARGLRFRPPCWLSDEWFCPDETPGIAIPFYLAHPRLMKLEDRMMLEVEGGSRTWCMQLLRHEAGHAYELAHRLGRRRRWLQVFGRAGKPYPEFYNPKPFSRRYVQHLDWWYAQSHPCEDFAETFAVWLSPRSQWRKRYAEWPVLKKLEYVDELMAEIGRQPAKLRTRRRIDPVSGLKSTLREYYRDKQERYGEDYPDYFDRDLRRLFVEPTTGSRLPRAATMLRRFAPELRNVVASWTGEYTYTVNMPLKDIIARCRELDLRVDRPVERVKLETAVMLTMQTTNFLHSSVHRLAM